MDKPQSTSPLVAASDVTFKRDDPSHIIITTGAKTYTLEAAPEQVDELRNILADIVPLLRDSESLARSLSPDQTKVLQPYVQDFVTMGVLLEAPQDIDTEAKRQFFTFLARRTSNANAAYKSAREQRFRFVGPDEPVRRWRTAFEEQGLAVDASETAASICIELVVDAKYLPEISGKYHAAGSAWVPIVLTPTGATVGPWVIPGETACPVCSESLGGLDTYFAKPVVRGIKTSWLSLQAGSLAWIGGLLTHSALRVVAPAGPHSPWGRRIDLDFLRTEQERVFVWKDPYCAACGASPRPTRLWIEG